MRKLKENAGWLWRIWPVISIAILALAHWFAWRHFGNSWVNLNKATGAILQTFGGGVVLFSINDNIGTFRQHGLLVVLKKYWADRPWKTPEPRHGALLFAECSDQFNVSATLGCAPSTVEERLMELERKLVECVALIHAKEAAINARQADEKAILTASIRNVSTQLEQLSTRVEKTLVDSIHMQVFGVFLAVYGTIVGYFA